MGAMIFGGLLIALLLVGSGALFYFISKMDD